MRRSAGTSGSRTSPACGTSCTYDQLPEVGVDRDQHPVQRLGELEQRPVTGVGAEAARLQDVVAATAKRLRDMPSGAAIDKEPHYPATETVSRVSRAMTACA